ncbi:DUF1501 domain-containing protein [Fulvivirga sp. M361]|uniref:DUF1501 domain-containing protein n=1 Tax=Fulvivirga sp. M361 TaxID=2594266 RepID=UPI00117AF1DE|nr:DUF1501 domain-containing protein [Fulvivirga sp. M361]TRX47316.1 DUF1501 domain-containing protein [Fulvivirga sp. M361]
MRRRSFLKKIPAVAGASLALNNVPVKVMAENSPFLRLAEQSVNDRVLIILQLHGGNDGLNMVIPVDKYDEYYFHRPNIAIPARNSVRKLIELDNTKESDYKVGLHPDMIGAKDLYDRGRMALVQGVSYPNNNGSHFRGRDIWHMGGGFEDYYSSGWVGRYLQDAYKDIGQYPEDFPNSEMLDPLAIEMGTDVSLVFHQKGNIPLSISLGGSPIDLLRDVNALEGFEDNRQVDPKGIPPETILDDSPYVKELNWILSLEDKTDEYAQRLATVFDNAGETKVTYPVTYPFAAPTGLLGNPLSGQLINVAKLLDGGGAGQGVKTKVFLLRMGGFDTHANQVESYDPTLGGHAAKMYHISSAMQAFQNDLRERGLEDRVLTITTSEFGRRIQSNGSFGTDHGTGAPMMIFGKGVKPGILGTTPDLSKANVGMNFDYRQVYASILQDWFEVDRNVVEQDILFGNFTDGANPDGGNFEALSLTKDQITSTEGFFKDRFNLYNAYPNPAVEETVISFYINTENHVKLTIFDQNGKMVKSVLNERKSQGEHSIKVNLSGIKAGLYFYKIESGLLNESKKLIIRN